ncbi:MAG: 2,5-diamino-6-(ribosylamino)-4(3H)-pyrimidinone 5'-phosphate reductase [Anaerolineae bacterium]
MKRPHVLINVAISADGKMDTFERQGAAISSPGDKERVLRLRASADAIMVGGKTLLSEDPSLTVKREALYQQRMERALPPNPIKVGVVTRADLNPSGNFLNAGPARVVIFTTTQTSKGQIEMLQSHRAEVFVLGEQRVDLPAALDILYQIGVRRLMVEGGGTLNFELLRQGLVDELLIYQAPIILGGATAPTLAAGQGLPRHAAIPLKLIHVESDEEGGILIHYQL